MDATSVNATAARTPMIRRYSLVLGCWLFVFVCSVALLQFGKTNNLGRLLSVYMLAGVFLVIGLVEAVS